MKKTWNRGISIVCGLLFVLLLFGCNSVKRSGVAVIEETASQQFPFRVRLPVTSTIRFNAHQPFSDGASVDSIRYIYLKTMLGTLRSGEFQLDTSNATPERFSPQGFIEIKYSEIVINIQMPLVGDPFGKAYLSGYYPYDLNGKHPLQRFTKHASEPHEPTKAR